MVNRTANKINSTAAIHSPFVLYKNVEAQKQKSSYGHSPRTVDEEERSRLTSFDPTQSLRYKRMLYKEAKGKQ